MSFKTESDHDAMGEHRCGSISSGMMSKEDLIPIFLTEAIDICLNDKRDEYIGAIKEIQQRIKDMDWDTYIESEESDWDLESLFDILDSIAPENHYFGAHEGDGADYGFWPVYEG